MAHFAEIDEAGNVLRVLVVSDEDCTCPEGMESEEEVGRCFLEQLLGPGRTWIQTSYNSRFRGRFAAVGMRYDATTDTFVHQAPPD